jgi:hypothetical protein
MRDVQCSNLLYRVPATKKADLEARLPLYSAAPRSGGHRNYNKPAARAHLYFAPSTSTGTSVVYG